VKVIRGLPSSAVRTPCTLTIGNFDGVHQGHQALLKKLKQIAKDQGLPTCVMTFEPHPREFFAPHDAPARILNLRDKLEALNQAGVDFVFVEHFNASFAKRSPESFVKDVLVDGLQTRQLVIGDDFCYGAKRAGNIQTLRSAGQEYGFEVVQMESVLDHRNGRISSSAIREALAKGELDLAEKLLGRPYAISGHVLHGRKLGRELGFPTLNIAVANHLHQRKPAASGIFVARVHGLGPAPLKAVASLGVRPTIEDAGRVLLETHVFEYDGNAYGKIVSIELLKKLRDEEKYSDLTTLQKAIDADAQAALDFFKDKNHV
jgi:riboflavin kinase/FMN adenylyltransferase